MAAEHESLRLNAALMRLGLRDWLPGFREFGVSEGEIAGGTGANDFGTDPAFACAAPGTGPPPPVWGVHPCEPLATGGVPGYPALQSILYGTGGRSQPGRLGWHRR